MFVKKLLLGGMLSFLLFAVPASFALAETPEEIFVSSDQAQHWIRADKPFTALSISSSKAVKISVKTPDTDWILVQPESPDDAPEHDQAEGFLGELVFFAKPETQFQFRTETPENQENIPFTVSLFSGERTSAQIIASTGGITASQNSYLRDTALFDRLGIITREQWGADESYRISKKAGEPASTDTEGKSAKEIECSKIQKKYPDEFQVQGSQETENGKNLRWPYQYSKSIEKIVIHHTASTLKDGQNPDQAVRSIYSYHANSRGWGDIGYNFLVAPNGNIYEGRAGGDYTVGGHAYCVNINTIGIALIGNFQDNTVPIAQEAALKKLLIGLSEKYQIDLAGSSYFHGEMTKNLLGHRDVGSTSCPGNNLYDEIPNIRAMLSSLPSMDFLRSIVRSADFVGKIAVTQMAAKSEYHFSLPYKNTGNIPWTKADTWLYAVLPDSDLRTLPPADKPSFVASLLRENTVLPGETGNFDVTIKAGNQGGLQTIEFIPVIRQQKIASSSVIVPVETEIIDYSSALDSFSSRMESPQDLFLSFGVKNTGSTVWKKENIELEVEIEHKKYYFSLSENIAKPNIAVFYGTIHFEKDPKLKTVIHAQLVNAKKRIMTTKPINKRLTTSFAPVLKALIPGLMNNTILLTHPNNTAFSYTLSIVNDGNTIWDQKNTILSVTGPVTQRNIAMHETTVAPGETANFSIQSKRPITKTTSLRFSLKQDHKKVPGAQGVIAISPTGGSIDPVPSPTPPPVSEKQVDEMLIRIRLGYTGTTATIAGTSSAILDGQTIFVPSGIPIQKEGDNIRIGTATGKILRLSPSSGGVLTVSSWDRIPTWDKTLNDNMFRGTLELRVYNGDLVVINELQMKDYLKGIAEVSNSAPAEKRKVIAVVARTYSAFYLDSQNRKFPGAPYDGDDNPNSFQKYLGYGYEKRAANFSQAVEDTKNIVVKYNGNLIKTPFFSESNGRTKSAEEVWGWTNTPYLISVDDTWCKNGKGTKSGHGVGLSGCGAEEMAKQGKSYQEILQYYYTGVTVEKR
ncbi:MAG: SpoIID/LytB domain-containing protein [Candidatus Peregrinibacteria bacterium]